MHGRSHCRNRYSTLRFKVRSRQVTRPSLFDRTHARLFPRSETRTYAKLLRYSDVE